MTKDEYQQQRDAIIKQYGKPEYILNVADNESAKKLQELKTIYLGSIREAKKQTHPIADVVEAVPEGKTKKALIDYLQKPIYIDEKYLEGFNGWERAVVEEYYIDRSLTHSALAKRFGVNRPQVTGLFNSSKFKALDATVFDIVFPSKVRQSLLSLLDVKDPKITLEAARTLKLLQNETQDITLKSKRIDDPEVIKLLKSLGDQ